MTQEIIDTGNVPGDGTGDPLRTAMGKINTNFDQIWTAGPVSSNVKVSNFTISTQITNSDLILAGNGIGNVQSSGSFVPHLSNTWSLGSSARRWKDIYTKDLIVANNFTANNISTTVSIGLPVYANATVRDATITEPTPGMMVFVTSIGLQVRGATQWNIISGSDT